MREVTKKTWCVGWGMLFMTLGLVGCGVEADQDPDQWATPEGIGGALTCAFEGGAYCYDDDTLGVCRGATVEPDRRCGHGCRERSEGLSDICDGNGLSCRLLVPEDTDGTYRQLTYPFIQRMACHDDPDGHANRASPVRDRNWDLDCTTPGAENLLAPFDGVIETVVDLGVNNKVGYGNRVCIRGTQGDLVCLNHMHTIEAVEGCSVRRAQVLGTCGTTGISSGPHLDIYMKDASGNSVELAAPVTWAMPTQEIPWSCDMVTEPTPTPSTCPSGAGAYCGTVRADLDPDTLYSCANGVYSVLEVCSASGKSCAVMPPGTNDACVAGCTDACTLGDVECMGGGLATCERGPNGCTRWTAPTACGAGLVCEVDRCVQAPACTQEGQVLDAGPWSICAYNTECAEQGTQSRVVTFCSQGQLATRSEQQNCTRSTEGKTVMQGAWSSCQSNGGSVCSESGSQTRTVQMCASGSISTRSDSQSCQLVTQGMSCGSGRVCEQGQCVSTCNATDYFSPRSVTGSDSTGTQHDQTIQVELELELRDKGQNNAIEYRVCKFENGSPSNFLGDDIRVYLENRVNGGLLVNQDIPTTKMYHCTGWHTINTSFGQGASVRARARVISPAYIQSAWNANTTSCTFSGSPGGSCWTISASTMTRTCL